MADAAPQQQDHELRSTSRNHKPPRSEKVETVASNARKDDTSSTAARTSLESAKQRPKKADSSAPTRTGSPESAILDKRSPSNGLNTMAAIASSNTNAQASNPVESNGPSPYGTRSRNRAGNSRPNYAEDRESEMDYEWTSGKKAQGSSALNTTQAVDNEKAITGHGRRAANGITNGKPAPGTATNSKEHIPGTSTFSVNAENGSQSKKRKAPGNGNTPAASVAQPLVSTSSRKAAHHIPASSCATRETNMVSFEGSRGYLNHGYLIADDKTRFKVNDTVYLVCEPPGEPYYLARIMEFLHVGNTSHGPVESLRINWIYRPRDIGRKATDTRLVFASMHSDTCPLTSLRGKCNVQHKSRIPDLEKYRKSKDSFYYNQMYERYIHRFYDVVPTSEVINVPERVKKVLDERWQFVIVESGRAKELTSAVKTCKRCVGYCASHDSVDCAMCKNTYHMNCVQPPLQKKPARGFAWSCGPCSRKQERKLEARNTPLVGERGGDGDEEEYFDEDEEDHGVASNPTNGSSPGLADNDGEVQAATKEQMAQAKLWPYRYLGIHCKVEDALDYDDRIYPRASSRLGPRHQANVLPWHGHQVEYVKPAEIKKKYIKGGSHKKDAKLSKETIAAMEAEKLTRERRPKWVIEEPPGFVHRGEDRPRDDLANTAVPLFKLPKVGETSSRGGDDTDVPMIDTAEREEIVDDYMKAARSMAPSFGLKEYSTNLLDKALELLYANDFDDCKALDDLLRVDPRKDLKEPNLSKHDLHSFEEAVAKYGSNLGDISRHVGKHVAHGEIVRFYYVWKKTERGKQIWGGYEGRKSKKQAKQSDGALLDDVADDYDDSAFDNDKASRRKRGFECKFCCTRQSRFWRRAPQTAPGTTVPAEAGNRSKDKGSRLMVALCQRCAGLWRKYAIQWENVDEIAKKVAQTGGRAFKRKMDEELLIELVSANEASSIGMGTTAVAAAQSLGMDVPRALTIQPEQEGPRKKVKTGTEKEVAPPPAQVEPPKKKPEKPPEPPLIPEQPKFRTLPCAVCGDMEPLEDEHFCCRHCRLTVHRNCYGISEGRSAQKWLCDMCSNDATNQYSTSYECILCPVQYHEVDIMEPPKASHKKKSDREREKERLEKEMVMEALIKYHQKQEESGRPLFPREPLKPTASNHWMHVVCAVWAPWIKFRDASLLDKAEGVLTIPANKFREVCKLCKTNSGVCVTCHKCPATFHITCAQSHNYPMGFDVTPVKGSRRDTVNSVTLGNESGCVEAVIYCREHAVKTITHPMNEVVEESGMNALQVFVRNFKQADLSLTGTVRKAAMFQQSRINAQGSSLSSSHRGSLSNGTSHSGAVALAPNVRSSRASPEDVTVKSEEVDEDGDRILHLESSYVEEVVVKQCARCNTSSSPKWYKLDQEKRTNGQSDTSALGIINIGDGKSDYSTHHLCHRCNAKRLREPSPPKPVPEDIHRPLSDDNQMRQTHSPPPSTWPPLPPAPQHHPSHWQSQAPAPVPYANTASMMNGVVHGPSQAIPKPPSPYVTPQAQYYTNGYDRREPPNTMPHPHPPAHQPNGPQSQYAHRRPSMPMEQQHSYPHPPPSHHGSPQFGNPLINGAHSPAMDHRIGQGPSGHPRAAENPFIVPQQSPRQHYHGLHGSPRPRTGDSRPMTPSAMHGRHPGWDRDRDRDRDRVDGQLTNGASASPSLRNLLL